MAQTNLVLSSGSSAKIKNNFDVSGAGADTIVAGNGNNIALSAGGNTLDVGDSDNITISGGGNYVSMRNYGALTINDARSVGDGYSGIVTFADSISPVAGSTMQSASL
jgi:hypothetical protein